MSVIWLQVIFQIKHLVAHCKSRRTQSEVREETRRQDARGKHTADASQITPAKHSMQNTGEHLLSRNSQAAPLPHLHTWSRFWPSLIKSVASPAGVLNVLYVFLAEDSLPQVEGSLATQICLWVQIKTRMCQFMDVLVSSILYLSQTQ